MAAILYQVVWQRTLFALLGVNVEAVTIIVTAFMLGLGLGALVGGQLSRAPAELLPARFALLELGVGLFGLVSLPVFHHFGEAAIRLSNGGLGGATFAMLIVPTMAMGATLPILAEYAAAKLRNTGVAVGSLYFVNTLGSAVGALLAALLLMRVLGEQGVVWFATACNGVAALIALRGAPPRVTA